MKILAVAKTLLAKAQEALAKLQPGEDEVVANLEAIRDMAGAAAEKIKGGTAYTPEEFGALDEQVNLLLESCIAAYAGGPAPAAEAEVEMSGDDLTKVVDETLDKAAAEPPQVAKARLKRLIKAIEKGVSVAGIESAETVKVPEKVDPSKLLPSKPAAVNPGTSTQQTAQGSKVEKAAPFAGFPMDVAASVRRDERIAAEKRAAAARR